MARTDGGLVVVSDAGPLIHLDELACLDLLADFDGVVVPGRVWMEVTSHRPAIQKSDVPGMSIVDVPAYISPQLLALGAAFSLHAGERDALAVVQDRAADLLLCDDAAACGRVAGVNGARDAGRDRPVDPPGAAATRRRDRVDR